MRHLDRSRPYQNTYGDDAARFPFFQDGLYFNQAGELMNIPHNQSVYASRGQDIAIDLAGDTAAPEQTGAPAPDDELAGKSPTEVFAIAERLRAQLDVAEDSDNYVPTAENAAENVEFIRRHLK